MICRSRVILADVIMIFGRSMKCAGDVPEVVALEGVIGKCGRSVETKVGRG